MIGVRSYGISVPTLEDVFLKVSKEQELQNETNEKVPDAPMDESDVI